MSRKSVSQRRTAQKSSVRPVAGARFGWLILALVVVCAVLIAVDPLVHKHGPFEVEHWLGFYGFYASLAALVAILGARALRALLARPESYYDE